MCSTHNLNNKQVVLTCYFSFSLFMRSNKKDSKPYVIKQHSHGQECSLFYIRILLPSIAIF